MKAAVSDISRFHLPQYVHVHGPVLSSAEKHRIVMDRGCLNGRIFQVQDDSGMYSPRSTISYNAHYNDTDVQQMQGTKPVVIVRDVSWFYKCHGQKLADGAVSGSDIGIMGFGPKISELFLPHVDRSGAVVTPLAMYANRVWGIDFLFDRVFDAAITISDPVDGSQDTMPFPGIRNNPFPKRIFATMEDEFVPDMFKVKTSDYVRARERINLLNSGVEDIPEGLMQPLKYATAVGLLDARTFGIYSTISGCLSEDFYSRVDSVRTFFAKTMSLLRPGGLLAIGRGGFFEGQHVNFHRIFLELAAELGFSMVYMIPDGEEFHDGYPWCESQHLFGFLNDGQRRLEVIKYPFPLDAFKTNRLGGQSFMDAEWMSEEGASPDMFRPAVMSYPNPAVNFQYRLITED